MEEGFQAALAALSIVGLEVELTTAIFIVSDDEPTSLSAIKSLRLDTEIAQMHIFDSQRTGDPSCLVQSRDTSTPMTYGPERHRRWPTDPHNYRHRR